MRIQIRSFWKVCGISSIYCTNESIAVTIGGTEVKASVMIPKRLILRLDKAAARGSVTSKSAVAIAEELPPSVTPRVT